MDITAQLPELAKLIRYYILVSTAAAGSGHATSSLSATELMTQLFFGSDFSFDLDNPDHPNNDRLIFSKGHASPLFYALYAAAGRISEKELLKMRTFDSPLEGHPTKRFTYTEVATGSLGQGLSIGVGMALNAKYLDKLPYTTYVLLGDSEMAEGSNWEAIQLASYYKLGNLVGIIDVNRLGQRGETMYGHDLESYQERVAAFGWDTILVDGHDFNQISQAYSQTNRSINKPTMIIAKTLKGKGVSFLENQEDWHGKALDAEQLEAALEELGPVDLDLRGSIKLPEDIRPISIEPGKVQETDTSYDKDLATRKAYGHALVEMAQKYPDLVVLDAEVSNSTFANDFKNAYPERFFEMFIAEQNMVGAAVGLANRGKKPFVSTFASFFTRAADQIRVAQYSGVTINFVGSHVGVSIGEDGPTQMGLEDIAIFRAILDSVVVYPSDHISVEKLTEELINHPGICYMRTTRADTAPLYEADETFKIGGSKTLKSSPDDQVTIVAAGITLHEALKAYQSLQNEGIIVRIIDLYSIKPLDLETLQKAVEQTKALITVEDHFAAGGLGEAVTTAVTNMTDCPIYNLAVKKMPRSGTPEELLAYEEIDAQAIINKVREII